MQNVQYVLSSSDRLESSATPTLINRSQSTPSPVLIHWIFFLRPCDFEQSLVPWIVLTSAILLWIN